MNAFRNPEQVPGPGPEWEVCRLEDEKFFALLEAVWRALEPFARSVEFDGWDTKQWNEQSGRFRIAVLEAQASFDRMVELVIAAGKARGPVPEWASDDDIPDFVHAFLLHAFKGFQARLAPKLVKKSATVIVLVPAAKAPWHSEYFRVNVVQAATLADAFPDLINLNPS
jgi:hypothetical protein